MHAQFRFTQAPHGGGTFFKVPPFLFILSRNDVVSMLKMAAKGGSRHAAHTVSTKSDSHRLIKKAHPPPGDA
jgi:hypothetical protein